MATQIHPTAFVEKGAQIDDGVTVGPYTYIGPRARLGPTTRVHHHATVEGDTSLGPECEIFPYALIGGKSQDLKYAGGHPPLKIGARNIFREFCTVHAATTEEGCTVIGNDNLFLAYAHIAHECAIGSHVVMSNNATLAGHVDIEDYAIIGGLTAIHQFCRIGRHAFLGGCAKVVQDVPPFMIADGHPAKVRAVNKIGMERSGYSAEDIRQAHSVFKWLYRSGLNRTQALQKLYSEENANSPIVKNIVEFIQTSQRGLA